MFGTAHISEGFSRNCDVISMFQEVQSAFSLFILTQQLTIVGAVAAGFPRGQRIDFPVGSVP